MRNFDLGLTWLVTDSRTGKVLAEIPNLQWTSLEKRFMDYAQATVKLAFDDLPLQWQDITAPMRTTWHLLRESDGVVLWSGLLLRRTRNLGDAYMSLELATWEYYLGRVYAGTKSYTGVYQTQIASDLIQSFAINGRHNCLTVTATASRFKRDRTEWTESSDKTVLDLLQDLAGVINGIEFDCRTVIRDDGTYAQDVLVADRIGGRRLATLFGVESLTKFSVDDDYTDGKGANRVQAVSTATGRDEPRPESAWMGADDMRPVVEYRFMPSTSIKNVGTLNSHARKSLAQLRDGTTSVDLAVDLSSSGLGSEWGAGDVIGWDITGARGFTGMQSGSARCIGWTISSEGSGTVTPILQNDGVVEDEREDL